MSSILLSVKEYCLVPEETTVYDGTLCDEINKAFFTLAELGCSKVPFMVEDDSSEWTDFTSDPFLLASVPTYVKQSAKLGFDPPANSFLVQQLEKSNEELVSRISYAVDPGWEVD